MMESRRCFVCSKFLLLAFNLILAGIGLYFFISAADHGKVKDAELQMVFTMVGVMGAALGAFGFLGACFESFCMLILYALAIGLALALEVYAIFKMWNLYDIKETFDTFGNFGNFTRFFGNTGNFSHDSGNFGDEMETSGSGDVIPISISNGCLYTMIGTEIVLIAIAIKMAMDIRREKMYYDRY